MPIYWRKTIENCFDPESTSDPLGCASIVNGRASHFSFSFTRGSMVWTAVTYTRVGVQETTLLLLDVNRFSALSRFHLKRKLFTRVSFKILHSSIFKSPCMLSVLLCVFQVKAIRLQKSRVAVSTIIHKRV